MSPRSPVQSYLMFVVFIIGIFGIALLAPSYPGGFPFLNGTNGTSLLANSSEDSALDPVLESTAMAPGLTDIGTPDPTPLITPAPLLTQNPVPTPLVVSTPPPVPTIPPPPADLMPAGTRYEYRDNFRKQTVSVSVKDFRVASKFSYHYIDEYIPDVITVRAKLGYRFFFVGVTWDLTGVVGEGSRTTFMTPAISSYRLVHNGVSYPARDPGTITDILQDALIGVGILAREESIDKDNPGDGFIIFEVPATVNAEDSYIELCPTNTIGLAEPHSPEWDCTKNPVRWSLVP